MGRAVSICCIHLMCKVTETMKALQLKGPEHNMKGWNQE